MTELTAWTAWSTCTHTCGLGMQSRRAACTTGNNNNNEEEGVCVNGVREQKKECNIAPCPGKGK